MICIFLQHVIVENKLSKEYTICLKNKAISEGKNIKTKIVNEDNKKKVNKFTSNFKKWKYMGIRAIGN